jgi:ubiquinone/menaquinone biosynthesis C-methylase UbiE
MENCGVNNVDSLKLQYSDASNFMARIRLSKKFSTNKYGWNRWIFDQINFPSKAKVLELGCGPAYLWKVNSHRLPGDAEVILSDFSEGMLEEAKRVLETELDKFDFKIINAEQIPYPDASFDIVIANLMLYHVPDRQKALSEISRVLKDGGIFYTTTIGLNNMKELPELYSSCFKIPNYKIRSAAVEFGLENGMEQLKEYFKETKLINYEDSLEVTEAKPLIDYILSSKGMGGNSKLINLEMMKGFEEYLEEIIKKEKKIKITKASGMFISRK